MDHILQTTSTSSGGRGEFAVVTRCYLATAAFKILRQLFRLGTFGARALSDDIVHVTYVSEVRDVAQVESGNRLSLWRITKTSCEICFHQRAPVA